MNGLSNLGPSPLIIDESNADHFVREIRDEHSPYFGGYDPSLYNEGGLAALCNRDWDGPLIPESEWRDRIAWQEEHRTSPDHWRRFKNSKVLDQKRTNYCWCFGVGGAAQNAIAMTGADVPHLSPAYTAAMIKGFRNVGGWGAEAIDGIQKFGMPTTDVYPEGVIDRQRADQDSVRRSAKLFDQLEFIRLPTERGVVPMEVMASVLLADSPMPITCGYNWWGHLVFASQFGYSGGWGGTIVNSWSERWGNQGCGFLKGSKFTPNEGIAIRWVEARNDIA